MIFENVSKKEIIWEAISCFPGRVGMRDTFEPSSCWPELRQYNDL